jgi:predicted O-methyltransferase YrrM
MFKHVADPKYVKISTPSKDALTLLDHLLQDNPSPVIAEVGVGVGATTWEFCQRLKNIGEIHLFDYLDRLDTLRPEITELGLNNVLFHANGRKTFDSYCWTRANILRERRRSGSDGMFDLVYLDGGHVFHHDAPAAIVLKELMKPGGYLLFDDFLWTLAISPTANPAVNKFTANNYSEEQISVSHVALVCELFFDQDDNFAKVDLGYRDGHELRRCYRKVSSHEALLK